MEKERDELATYMKTVKDAFADARKTEISKVNQSLLNRKMVADY
jgi:hypothetical protein